MSLEEARKLLAVARHDADCADLLARAGRDAKPPRDVSDWLITMQFYVLCLHVQALSRCRGHLIERHEDLRQWINTERDLWGMARAYRLVEERSRDARYKGRLFTRAEVVEFNGRFRAARDHILPLLAQAGLNVQAIEPLLPEDFSEAY
jgi:hypothetical protein